MVFTEAEIRELEAENDRLKTLNEALANQAKLAKASVHFNIHYI